MSPAKSTVPQIVVGAPSALAMPQPIRNALRPAENNVGGPGVEMRVPKSVRVEKRAPDIA